MVTRKYYKTVVEYKNNRTTGVLASVAKNPEKTVERYAQKKNAKIIKIERINREEAMKLARTQRSKGQKLSRIGTTAVGYGISRKKIMRT